MSRKPAELPILIIGAGPTGIGAALRLQELGVAWRLLERNTYPGGLATSFKRDGFVWDVGGHVIFSHYDAYDQLLKDVIPIDQWIDHPRNAQVRVDDLWIPYPFQLNLDALPLTLQSQCHDGLRVAQEQGLDKSHFLSYIDSHFGKGIADLFMRPYNEKIWACELNLMSVSWLGERVASIDKSPVRQTKKNDWGPNSKFRFPESGGTGSIWQKAASQLEQQRVTFDAEVVDIEIAEHRLSTLSGMRYGYKSLVNTMPIDQLCFKAGLENHDDEISKLVHTSVHVIGLGIKGEVTQSISDMCWMYFPDVACPFYRATVFSRYSPNNTPVGTWSLMLEVSESNTRPVDCDLINTCIQACLSLSLIDDQSDIIHQWHHREEYGYPVPTLKRNESLNALHSVLESNDIYSRGRFGAWKYEVGNMDHCYMQGREIADRLVLGSTETIFNCG